jgi:hypothetical protein
MSANHSALHIWLHRHRVSCFVLMTVSFIAFGALSLDLVRLVRANANLLWEHGLQGVMDGGLQQLAELWFSAFGAVGCYLVFKLCEHILVLCLATRQH